jgi:chromosome segregation ATPase
MKRCPQCEKENPSVASCCMHCSSDLSEKTLDETERIQKDLDDTNGTVILLEKTLTKVEKQKQECEQSKREIQTLQSEIAEKDRQNTTLAQQLQTTGRKSKTGYVCLFAALFVLLAVLSVGFYKHTKNSDTMNELNSAISHLKQEEQSNRKQYDTLSLQYAALLQENDELKEQIPVTHNLKQEEQNSQSYKEQYAALSLQYAALLQENNKLKEQNSVIRNLEQEKQNNQHYKEQYDALSLQYAVLRQENNKLKEQIPVIYRLEQEKQSNQGYKEQYDALSLQYATLLQENDDLKEQAPVTYKVIVTEAKCYRQCEGSYEYTNCVFTHGDIVDVYVQRHGYGLTTGGYLMMSDLEKYE